MSIGERITGLRKCRIYLRDSLHKAMDGNVASGRQQKWENDQNKSGLAQR